MRVINFDFTDGLLSQKNPLVIYVFADTHFGFIGADLDKLAHHIEMCREENAYWLHLGDWCDAIGPWDRRFDIHAHPDPVEYQYQIAQQYFEPIAKKGIAVLQGNHDNTIRTRVGDKVGTLAHNLGVPYLGYSGFIGVRAWSRWRDLKIRKNASYSFTIFLHHGRGGGFLLGAKAINMQRASHSWEADLYLFGHIHTHLAHVDEYLGINRSNHRIGQLFMWRKNRRYYSTPGYYRGLVEGLTKYDHPHTTYVERSGHYPQPTGCLRIEIFPVQKDIATRRPEGSRDSTAKKLEFSVTPLIT